MGGSRPKSKKPFEIPKRLVFRAWRQVRANDGAPGVDGVSVAEFETDLQDNLYKVWNRMSSGERGGDRAEQAPVIIGQLGPVDLAA